MDLVETYFKPEYEEYHRNLSDATVLEATVRDAKDTVETVSTQFQSTTLLLQEFQGDFVEELDESIVLLIEELKMSNSLINDSLEPTIEAMKTLGSKLGDLKTNDGLYKEQKTKYQQLSNSDNRLIEDHESEEYKDWLSERNNAETTLKGYIDVCKGLQEECDSYIKTIEDFNNSVVDLRLKLTYFAISQSGIPVIAPSVIPMSFPKSLFARKSAAAVPSSVARRIS